MTILHSRKWFMGVAFLSLAAGACVCSGVFSSASSTAEDARNTVGTAQAIATDIGGVIDAGQAIATDVSGVVAVGEAFATDIAPLGATVEAGIEELIPTLIAADEEEVRQWAFTATATSQRDVLNYAAAQAVGLPNTPNCGDAPSAWASLEPNARNEELTVLYAQAVVPTEIVIYESFNPGYITQVRVIDVFGDTPIVYQSAPAPISAESCPRTFTIPITTVTQLVTAVVITIDQAVAPSWTQIDAVELVGIR